MASAPDSTATPKQRGFLATHGLRDLANDERLTFAEAARRIDLLKNPPAPTPAAPPTATPAPPAPGPTPAERQATTVEGAEAGKGLFIQVAAWIPVERVSIVVDAIRQARAGVA